MSKSWKKQLSPLARTIIDKSENKRSGKRTPMKVLEAPTIGFHVPQQAPNIVLSPRQGLKKRVQTAPHDIITVNAKTDKRSTYQRTVLASSQA